MNRHCYLCTKCIYVYTKVKCIYMLTFTHSEFISLFLYVLLYSDCMCLGKSVSRHIFVSSA